MEIKFDFSLSFILTVVFIVLKILNVVDWAWIWVFSPIWISLILTIVIIIIWKIWVKLRYR